jgi:CheY-like chemotaxis protein
MSESSNGKATILIADDHEANRDLLSEILSGPGYNVICFLATFVE